MINWPDVDTVLLDMDGTLLDLYFDNHFWTQEIPARYARASQLDTLLSIEELQARFNIEPGTLQWYCLDHWSAQLDMDVSALKREMAHMIRLRPFALEFLRRLNASHCDVVLVTNAHRTALEIKMDQVNIGHWFDRMVVSHELDAPKESQNFWRRLQDIHPFNPARTLLIDDTERILHAAREFGIAHLLTLLQPDSSRQARIDSVFPGIHHFDEIMPDTLEP